MLRDALFWSSNPNGFAPLGNVLGIALHHTVTTISPLASEAEEEAHARAIDSYHAGKKWGGIGYHYLVFPSGRAYRVGWGQRAHVANRNHELIGIAWVGDLSARVPGEIEIAAAAECVADAWRRIGREVPCRGHREWAVAGWETACPANGMYAIESVEREARQGALDMTPEEVRQIVRDELGRISLNAGLGTNNFEEAIAALWSRFKRLGNRLQEAADTLDPFKPWK